MPSVEKGRELWFLGLFLSQYLGGLALIYWLGLCTGELKFLEAGALATALIIMSTAHAVVIVEGVAMLAESFLKRRYEAGLQEGRAEGRDEGQSVANAEWDAWLERRTRTGAFVPDDNDPPPSRVRGR